MLQETIEKTDASGKILPEMVSCRARHASVFSSCACLLAVTCHSSGLTKIAALQILICQNLRNNLQHPNEYIRGVTLRFLCRIREEEIFEPLIPSILTCLEHRHSYVRRNAVLAINSIYKLPKGEMHLQDAPDLIEKVLTSEQDLSTKRNAFLMLCNHAQDRAVHYLLSQVDNVAHWGDILQMAVLELIRKVMSHSA